MIPPTLDRRYACASATSTPLLQHGAVPKTADQLEAEELVRDLLKFQKSNGRFVFGNFETLKSTLGPSFVEVVVRLRAKHHDFDTVVTIAMVALLEEQFQDCQELWALITRKATAFVNQCALGHTRQDLEQEARLNLKSIRPVLEDLRSAKRALVEVMELEFAPVS